jgi:DNA-directed RNA polymerase subunit RPC12/RpoP
MPEHFINLNCANCGGKLEVYDDMDRFACGYCGTQMLVQRRGGTVAIKAVTDAIEKVQVGTDKTAAELALVRLQKELQPLTDRLLARPLTMVPFSNRLDTSKPPSPNVIVGSMISTRSVVIVLIALFFLWDLISVATAPYVIGYLLILKTAVDCRRCRQV